MIGPADHHETPMSRASVMAWCATALLVLSLGLDSVPRFHLGDSRSYLMTRWYGYIPDDRSWTYGLVICPILYLSRDLTTVMLLQVAFSCASMAILTRNITRCFNVPRCMMAIVFLVGFANPLDFYWSRAFMTDTVAASLFALLIGLLLTMRTGLLLTIGSSVLLWLIVSFRSVYLPPLFIAFSSVSCLYLLRAARSRKRMDAQSRQDLDVAARFSLLAAVAVASYMSYALANSKMVGVSDISVNYAAPRFLVSAWSPLMSQSADQIGIGNAERSALIPFTHENRLAQAFDEHGIDETLRRKFGSHPAAKPAYNLLLKEAILHRPIELTRLIIRSWIDYLTPSTVLLYQREMRLSGAAAYKQPNTLDPGMLDLFKRWKVWQTVSPDLPRVGSFGLTYFSVAGGYWALFLSFFSTFAIFMLFLLPKAKRSPEIIALQIFAFSYMLMVATTTNEMVTRYLIPLGIPALVWVAAITGKFSCYSSDRRALATAATASI